VIENKKWQAIMTAPFYLLMKNNMVAKWRGEI